MMMDANVNRATPQRSAATSHSSPDSEKTRGAAANPSEIAERAYELYEQRGRQEGRALEDWFNAEHQLAGVAGI
jgi:Protein of unknown function (DUF2934).